MGRRLEETSHQKYISKHKNIPSASDEIGGMQITKMRHHCRPIIWPKIWNTDNSKYCERCKEMGALHSCLVGMENGIASLEDIVATYITKHTVSNCHIP